MDSLLNILKLRSIKHQLKAIFAMLVVLPIVIIGVYAYVVSKSNVTELTRASMKGSAEVIANGIEMGVKRETDVIKFFSYDVIFNIIDYSLALLCAKSFTAFFKKSSPKNARASLSPS